MLASFAHSGEMQEIFSLSLSYRYSASYYLGLQRRIGNLLRTYPLRLPDHFNLGLKKERLLHKFFYGASRIVLQYPYILYDILRLCILFGKLKPDILHINSGGYPGAISTRAAAIAGRLAGIKVIIMVVNNLAIPYGANPSRWLDWPLDALVKRSVILFITGSKAAKDRLIKVLSLYANKIKTLHNGIGARSIVETLFETRARLGQSGFRGLLCGVVAVLEKRKGHIVLLHAISILVNRGCINSENFYLFVEGSGSLRTELFEYTVENKIDHLVRFIPPEVNIFDFIGALDVVILPSIADEDFPNIILEAMLLGPAIIASNIAGTSEQIFSGESGLLVPPGDVEALADAILICLNNSHVRYKLSLNAKERFHQNFTLDVAVRRYIDLYRVLCLV